MRIAVNAMSLRKGGTVIALGKLLSRLVELEPQHEFHILADGSLPKPLLLDSGSVHYHHFPWTEGSHLRTAMWYVFVLPYWLARMRIDILFSSSCYLPLKRPQRTVLLVQDAKYFYDSREFLKNYSPPQRLLFHVKRFWTYYSVSVANSIVVQSRTLADLVVQHVPSARTKLAAIPHGPGFLDGPARVRTAPHFTSDSLEIAYVALYRSYKNFDVLTRALKLLRARNIPVRLHLTLDVVEDAGARSVMSSARRAGVEDLIVNHGELEPERVCDLYRITHVFVFPSICESFGFPQVEAMAFGLPLLVADTPVNREVCGQAAMFFPPEDAAELAAALEHLYRNPATMSALAERSARRGREFDWTRAATETLRCLTEPEL